jgi:GAF domain-containing protein
VTANSSNSSLPAGSGLSELAGLLLSTQTFEDLVQGVAELSVRTVGPAATCGITLAQDGRVITVGASDSLATQLDEQQYEHHTGPCLEALKIGEVVEAVDLAVETRWGVYPAVAISYGIQSVLSTPLIVNDQSVGVLNLYARTALAFSDVDRQLALLLAGQATIAITAALRHYDEITLSDHLRTALSSRSIIDQAIGILMGQQRCGPEEAFALLRAASQQRNIKLREVAANLVTTIQRRPHS